MISSNWRSPTASRTASNASEPPTRLATGVPAARDKSGRAVSSVQSAARRLGASGISSVNRHGPLPARRRTASRSRGAAAVRFATTSTLVVVEASAILNRSLDPDAVTFGDDSPSHAQIEACNRLRQNAIRPERIAGDGLRRFSPAIARARHSTSRIAPAHVGGERGVRRRRAVICRPRLGPDSERIPE